MVTTTWWRSTVAANPSDDCYIDPYFTHADIKQSLHDSSLPQSHIDAECIKHPLDSCPDVECISQPSTLCAGSESFKRSFANNQSLSSHLPFSSLSKARLNSNPMSGLAPAPASQDDRPSEMLCNVTRDACASGTAGRPEQAPGQWLIASCMPEVGGEGSPTPFGGGPPRTQDLTRRPSSHAVGPTGVAVRPCLATLVDQPPACMYN